MTGKVAGAVALVAALTLSLALAGPGEEAARPMTLGGFSRALVEALRASGTPVSEKVQVIRGMTSGRERIPLTEGLAVTLLGAAGVEVSTLNPQGRVSEARAMAILRGTTVQAAIAGSASSGQPATPFQGSIEPCLGLSNHGKCVVCCKEQGMHASTCAKACFVINKASPSEPLP